MIGREYELTLRVGVQKKVDQYTYSCNILVYKLERQIWGVVAPKSGL